MASKYTENYGLCQWEAKDQVLREEFNGDNEKIDATLKSQADTLAQVSTKVSKCGNCEVSYQSYTGNNADSRTFSFPFQPLLVVITGGDRDFMLFTRGQTAALGHRGGGHTLIDISWGSNSVTITSSGGYYDMCNISGRSYMLVAFSQA